MADLKPTKVRVTTEAECGAPIRAEAWRYEYKTHDQIYIRVTDAAGNDATFRLIVRRRDAVTRLNPWRAAPDG